MNLILGGLIEAFRRPKLEGSCARGCVGLGLCRFGFEVLDWGLGSMVVGPHRSHFLQPETQRQPETTAWQARDHNGCTPLMFAVANGNEARAEGFRRRLSHRTAQGVKHLSYAVRVSSVLPQGDPTTVCFHGEASRSRPFKRSFLLSIGQLEAQTESKTRRPLVELVVSSLAPLKT